MAVILTYPQNLEAQTSQANEATQEKLRAFERDTRVDTSLTIGEVAAMPAHDGLAFVVDVTARRGLVLGLQHGDDVLACLGKEFRGIKQQPDGSYVYPRGLEAAIRYLHIANNNGDEHLPAAEHIGAIVDLVGERVCNLPPSASTK